MVKPDTQVQMRKRRRLILGMTVLTVGAATVLMIIGARTGFVSALESGTPERTDERRAIPVRVIETERRDFVEYGEYFGEARGIAGAVLSAGAGGRVTAIHADQGDYVRVGDSLAEIDLERVDSRYQTAVLAEKLARENYEREQRFLREGNTFQLKVDQAHLDWLQARNNLLDARRMREDALAISPVAGTVVTRYIELYDDLDHGDVTFRVADLSSLVVTVGVPESDMAGVRELRHATVQFGSIPDRTFEGVPVSFARRRSDRTLTYQVDIEIENPDELILAGQTARVRLELRRYPDVVVVPNRAIFTRNDRAFVMVADDGYARETPVRTGVSDAQGTVILEGLSAGQRIVADGFNRLGDGSPITIVE